MITCHCGLMRKTDLNNFHVATSETARDINRRIVLNLIRSHHPISRADLARHSGLQRSTVSVIIEQLIAERWVSEGANGHTPRGRRPRFLHLNKDRVGVIGVSIRPENTSIGFADLDGQFLAQESFPTSEMPDKFVRELVPRLRSLIRMRPEFSCEGIGVSLPGRVDLNTQRLAFTPNLPWGNFDLRAPLEKALGLPVELENAANACALAEVWFGSHTDGVRNLIAITVSEGIGTGLILNHQLVRGSSGTAGEFGHATIVENGIECRCGNRGCWEMYASESAAVRYYAKTVVPTRSSRAGTAVSQAVRPSFDDLLRLAEQNDAKALAALNQMAQYLGLGIAQLVSGLAPDVITVIGEVTRVWRQIGPVIEKVVRERSRTHAETRIVPTDPSTQPRLRGTIALVLQKHFWAPLFA